MEPERRDGSNARCRERKSSSDMMSSASSEASLFPDEFAVNERAIGGVYGRGVARIGYAYGAVGRCGPEETEKLELLLVERLCSERAAPEDEKARSEAERASSTKARPAILWFSA